MRCLGVNAGRATLCALALSMLITLFAERPGYAASEGSAQEGR